MAAAVHSEPCWNRRLDIIVMAGLDPAIHVFAATPEKSCALRPWMRSCARHVSRDRRGTTALEFALTALASFGLVLFAISLGFRLYVQAALNYAGGRAARMLAVDSMQSLSKSAGSFQTATFCPLLSPFLACANLSIALVSVTDYRTGSSIGGSGPPPFSPGQSGSLMLLQASYRMPALSWPLPSDASGGSFAGMVVTASYPYQNEY